MPVVAIVGRTNVGKSTLFNALTRTRDALVADLPGVTRDRQYGLGRVGSAPYILIDTGGLVDDAQGLDYLTAQQVLLAIEESQLVIFLVDARDGLTAADEEIAAMLRRNDRPVQLTINKVDGLDADTVLAEFAELGLPDPVCISSAHRRGLGSLIGGVFEQLPDYDQPPVEDSDQERDSAMRLAIVGRPNVGKSTLVNRLLGEERVLSYNLPGTTRDTISARLERDGREYVLLDTAGVRRRSRVTQAIEKFSIIKAMQAIEKSHVVIVMMDATEGLTEQDSTLLGHVLEQGRALVIAVNKWDNLDPDQRKKVLDGLDRKLEFVTFARRVRISALHGSGIAELMRAVEEAYQSATRDLSTAELTRVLQRAFEDHQPAMKQGRTARLRYAHAGGKLPPRIIIHGNRTDTLQAAYKRYLINRFRKYFKLHGTPLVLLFKDSTNPYAGKKNVLTQRQLAKRKRLRQFVSRKRK